ncbi:VCBS repeat-containing protein [Luteimonas sp. MC1825]|uniref:FG-GAP repeat domain-containing protein n=1 Tax=Luteimonas sp. MC1825 TaxID=2761107 RepID=UPI00161CBFB6|nr:VCBS repeat-containing protein [Luteimonas sp. MC1825]MBB6600243.1 VCBS repeat-containing protein [Luteimonas sp. MC1825]QOC87928.1 VCBS repeat-containing protein [Luteimonas sp. MC1825]
MHREPPAFLLLAALLAAACAAPVDAAPAVVPDVVKTRINEVVAACARAGGRLGDVSGQGRFVIPADFNGDGHTDFVVSEGNVPCDGAPALFRENGLARVELYTGTGTASAQLVFADHLLAYRVLAGSPARLQIARRGEACGGGSGAANQCGAELRWNAAQARFDEVPTGSRGAAAQGTASGPAATPVPVAANARTAHLERCRAGERRDNPKKAAADIDSACGDLWDKIEAAGPLADVMLAAVPARAGEPLTLADLRARVPAARWGAGAPVSGATATAATGRLGALDAWVGGTASAPKSLALGWSEVGADPPYDLPGALAARGAKLEPLGCYHFGAGEVNAVYVVNAPGRPPFALTIYTRGAPVAQATAQQNMSVALDGVLPTRASLRAEHRDPPWEDPCTV